MKRNKIKLISYLLIAIFAVFSFITILSGQSNDEIKWINSYDEGLKQAKATDKNMFILITAPSWCVWCQKLEINVLLKTKFVNMVNSGFIPVRIFDTSSDINKFEFEGYPTVFIYDKNGKKLAEPYSQVMEEMYEAVFPYYKGDKENLNTTENNELPYDININGLNALYTFNDNNRDLVNDYTVQLNNVETVDGSIYLDGRYASESTSDSGFTALFYIDNLDYSNFTVHLDFKHLDDLGPILIGGEYYRWFGLKVNSEGNLELSFNNFDDIYLTNTKIKKDKWYNIICSVDLNSKTVKILIDGKTMETINLPSTLKLRAIEENISWDKVFTFTNYANGQAFHGYADNFIEFNRALYVDEMEELYNIVH